MLARRALPALVAFSALACGDLPGEVVGSYKITMKLEENSCGRGAVHLLDGHRYAVQLRAEGETGYWHVPGQQPLAGDYEAPRFHFERSGIVASAGPDAGPRACTLRQRDVLTGELGATGEDDAAVDGASDELDPDAEAPDEGEDAGAEEPEEREDAGTPANALRAEHTFTISAVSGTDCADAVAPRGPFAALPCTVRYSVRGVAREP